MALPGARRRFALVVEYDGTAYRGFQAQAKAATVQGVLEQALRGLLGRYVKTDGAGRTDAGAHAAGQVVAFTTDAPHAAAVYPRALNAALPDDVRVTAAAETAETFDPRRDARRRQYRYLALNRRAPSALWGRYTCHVRAPLDLESMRRAAEAFCGVRDFRAFCGASRLKGRDTVREVFGVEVWRQGPVVAVDMTANAFLPQQARRIAGTLMRVGRGQLAAAAVPALLDGRSDEGGGPALPARGLCLMHVVYPEGVLDISGPGGPEGRGTLHPSPEPWEGDPSWLS